MLIDVGESDQGEVVTDYLKNQGISTLDYVVATHPTVTILAGWTMFLTTSRSSISLIADIPIPPKHMRIC